MRLSFAATSWAIASGVCSLTAFAASKRSLAVLSALFVSATRDFAVSRAVCLESNSDFAVFNVSSACFTASFAFSIRTVGLSSSTSVVSNLDGSWM